jgi:hypothetical protein
MDTEDTAPPAAPTPRRLGGATVQLAPLRSHAERWDLAQAAAINVQRACAAALGLSWLRLRKVVGKYNGDAIEYGGTVIDYLIDQGSSYDEIILAGLEALKLATDGLAGGKEVREKADFSEASEGA